MSMATSAQSRGVPLCSSSIATGSAPAASSLFTIGTDRGCMRRSGDAISQAGEFLRSRLHAPIDQVPYERLTARAEAAQRLDQCQSIHTPVVTEHERLDQPDACSPAKQLVAHVGALAVVPAFRARTAPVAYESSSFRDSLRKSDADA